MLRILMDKWLIVWICVHIAGVLLIIKGWNPILNPAPSMFVGLGLWIVSLFGFIYKIYSASS